MNLADPPRVIITGASSGIGKALSLQAAKMGYRLCLAARNEHELQMVATECQNLGAQVIIHPTNVSSKVDCQSLINKTVAQYNGIDILINNAGISMRASLEKVELEAVERVMNVNFMGTLYCTKFALPYLLQSKGSVVGVSSVAGFIGLPARTAYSASKFAMHGFLEALRLEYKAQQLHVLIACPGFTATNIRQHALNHKGQPQMESPRNEQQMMSAAHVARCIWKAISYKKHHINIGAEAKMSYLLHRIFPGLVKHLAYLKMKKEPQAPF
jgi:short-subunit dehydrogenase